MAQNNSNYRGSESEDSGNESGRGGYARRRALSRTRRDGEMDGRQTPERRELGRQLVKDRPRDALGRFVSTGSAKKPRNNNRRTSTYDNNNNPRTSTPAPRATPARYGEAPEVGKTSFDLTVDLNGRPIRYRCELIMRLESAGN